MVEAIIEIDSQFILRWFQNYLIKLYDAFVNQLAITAERGREEIRFLMEFEYTRSNIIDHLCQKASQFFGYDPEEEGSFKRKLTRRKKHKKRQQISFTKTIKGVKKKSNVLGLRKKSKKNKNYFIPKTE